MGLSDYLANELLDHVFGNGAYTPPGTVYVALYTSPPDDDGTGGTEIAGNDYARVPTTGSTWDAASDRAIANGTVIQFPTPSGSWGTATHFGALDASTSGNLLWWGALSEPQAIGTGNDVEFAAGDLVAEFDPSS